MGVLILSRITTLPESSAHSSTSLRLARAAQSSGRGGESCWITLIVVPRYITACELAQHPLHHQRLGRWSRRGTAEVPSQPPKAQRTKGERRRRAKASPESNKSLQLPMHRKRGGGDLHRLQLNHKRRLPQDGPAAAQLRWTTYSGGVLHLLHRKARDIKEPCGVCDYLTRSKELISSLSPSLAQTPTRSQFERGLRPLPSQSDFPPAGALLSFIFKNPPPSPHDRPWSMRTTDADCV